MCDKIWLVLKSEVVMDYKIVISSSANIVSGGNIVSVPLKIITPNNEYVDDEKLDLEAMLQDLRTCNGKTGTSCPNINDWLSAFGDCQNVFVISISSNVSGAYNSARLAAEEYQESHKDANIHVIDSLNAGPGERIVLRKLVELIDSGLSFEEIVTKIDAYNASKRIVFALENLTNLANNGRCSKLMAGAANLLGIRVIGTDDNGRLYNLDKAKGEKRTLKRMFEYIKQFGYKGGRIVMDHCQNPDAAEAMCKVIRSEFPDAEIEVSFTRGLCSFYSEDGGLLVAFETEC